MVAYEPDSIPPLYYYCVRSLLVLGMPRFAILILDVMFAIRRCSA